MILKIVCGIDFGLCFLLLVLGAFLGKKVLQKIGFPMMIKIMALVLTATAIFILLFSLIFENYTDFYETVLGLINSVFAAWTALVLIFTLCIFLVFFCMASSKNCVEQQARFSLDTMPERFGAVEKALEKGLINEKEASGRFTGIQKMQAYFEKCVVSSRILYRCAYIQLAGLGLSGIVKFFALKIPAGNSWSEAFTEAVAVSLWNGIVIVIPVIMLCFSLGVSFTDDNQRKILKKIGKVEKFKEEGDRPEKSETEDFLKKKIFIQIGYGLIYLIQEDYGNKLLNAVREVEKKNPEFKINILDCKELDMLEYRIDLEEKETGGMFGKHSTDEERIKEIVERVLEMEK